MRDSTERRLKNSNHFQANSETLSARQHFIVVGTFDGSQSRVSVLAATAIANPNVRSL